MDKTTDLFLNIIDDHKRLIYKVANSYCKKQEDRQDLIQEIILQLWRSFDKYNSQFKLSTWIYRIALNTAISFYRKNKNYRQKTTALTPILDVAFETESPVQENSNLTLLQEFIQDLKELDKAIIILYLEGLSHKEIAKVVGITATNAGTKITRIKQKLKNKFNNLSKL